MPQKGKRSFFTVITRLGKYRYEHELLREYESNLMRFKTDPRSRG